jgi:hypothetical protein
VFDVPLEKPGGGLQTGVRVSGNHHAIGLLGRAKVIYEAPSANHLEFGVRNSASNLHPGSSGEFHRARLNQHLVSLFWFRRI